MGGSKDYNIQNSIWIGTDTITPTPPIRGHFKLSYTCKEYCILLGTAVIVIVWYLDVQLPVQSEPIVLLAIVLSVLPRFTDSDLPLWYLPTLLPTV
jgi:hypothetical protein